MAGFSILGKVGLDISGYTKGLAAMKNATGPAMMGVGQQIKGQLMNYLGAAGIAALLKRTADKAFDLRRDSSRLGLTAEELQTLQVLADKSGESVEALAQRFREAKLSGGAFADEVTAAKDELLGLYKIMEEGNVQILADARDRVQELASRVAPGVGALAQFANWAHGKGTDAMTAGLGMAHMVVSPFKGGKDWREVGASMVVDGIKSLFGFGKQDQPSASDEASSAMEKLLQDLRDKMDLERWWNDVGGNEAQKESSKQGGQAMKMDKPEVSSLTKIGGYMNGSLASSRNTTDDILKGIRENIAQLVSLYRQKE